MNKHMFCLVNLFVDNAKLEEIASFQLNKFEILIW